MRNIKQYLFMILIGFPILSAVGSPALSEPYQCDVNGDMRLGLDEVIYGLQFIAGLRAGDSHSVLECGAPPAFSGVTSNPGILSPEAKSYLLCQLNATRSKVALGESEAYGGGFHPVATNMQRVMWDDNLATVASNHAAQCD